MEKISCIYSIINITNNKIYIGSSINKDIRWREHLNKLRLNKHHSILLQRAWNKYGEDQFKFDVIEIVEPSKDKLKEREQYYLDLFQSYNPEKGYNILPKADSRLGVKASAETKEKLRISHLGQIPSQKTREGASKANTGRKGNNLPLLPRETRYCACNCGQSFVVKSTSTKRFIKDHYNKVRGILKPREIRTCLCGCGETFEVIVTSPKRLIYRHMPSGRPSPRLGIKATNETREKQRISHLGKKQTQETIDKRMKNRRGKIIVPREVRICSCGCNGTFIIRKTLPDKYLPGHYIQFLKRSKDLNFS